MENFVSGISLMILGLFLFVFTQFKPKYFVAKSKKHHLIRLLNKQNIAIPLYMVSVTFIIAGLLVVSDII